MQAAETFEGLLCAAPRLTVTSVRESEARKLRPVPLNTVEMLKIASKALGMAPSYAMRAAESLYLSGYGAPTVQCDGGGGLLLPASVLSLGRVCMSCDVLHVRIACCAGTSRIRARSRRSTRRHSTSRTRWQRKRRTRCGASTFASCWPQAAFRSGGTPLLCGLELHAILPQCVSSSDVCVRHIRRVWRSVAMVYT